MKSNSNYNGYKCRVPTNVKVESFRVYPDPNDLYYHETRYRLVDGDTGEVFDDAQGRGYRSAVKALSSFRFKNRPREAFEQQRSALNGVQEWCAQNKDLCKKIKTEMQSAAVHDEYFGEDTVAEIIGTDVSSELPFAIRDLVRAIRRM